jgi:hypothetical protein
LIDQKEYQPCQLLATEIATDPHLTAHLGIKALDRLGQIKLSLKLPEFQPPTGIERARTAGSLLSFT